jgi:hypothetical protein
MKQVKCTNPKNFRLTLNSNYIVLAEENNFYSLTNDSGKIVKYSTSLFEDVEVVIQAPVAPPVIVIPRTEQDCINSIQFELVETGQDDNFTIVTKYKDLENDQISFNTNVTITGTIISCGVFQLSGLNEIMKRILQNVNTVNNDLELLIKNLFKKTLCYVLENFIHLEQDFRFLLLSTNNDNNYEDFFTYLTEMSDVETEWKGNPNSGNFIKTWIVDVDNIL